MAKTHLVCGLSLALCGGLFIGYLVGGNAPTEKKRVESAQPERHVVQIRTPSGCPTISTGLVDMPGQSIEVRCGTCHAGQAPNPHTRSAEALDQFHQSMPYDHGNLTCLSCHNRDDYETLRLASGESVAYEQVMQLCSQCHGPQARDYAHGAHGGMTGYWDLTQGARVRNNCIDCHAPHRPAYPKVRPVFAPKDRFPPATSHE